MPYTSGFKKLQKAVAKEYLRKPVPHQYQKRYGKRYSKEEVKSVSFAVAKSRGISIH